MKVLRSTLFVAATAIIAAACGDKVNVQGPTTATPKINSVQVAPSSATISVGQSVTLTAAVNADAGLTTTTVWSSSSAAASVTQGGVVLGVTASPGVAVCATVTAGTQSVENCATVVVQPIATVVPATVQITSVTGANLNTPVAVPPGVVAGQINVSVTANPGTARLDSVVVYINGIAAGTQTLTAAQAAALRSAANEAAANQQVVAPIVFSINTAAYNTTTGAVTYLNGPMVISAVAYGHQGTSASTNTASQSLSYILGNADGFQTSVAVVPNSGTGTAIDATGFAWMGNGALKVTAIPVMYSGKTVGTVTASLGASTGLCVAGVGAAVSSSTATAGAYVITLPLAAAQSPAGCTTTTPNLPVIAATDNLGNVLTLVANGTVNTQAGVRWDNVAPSVPAITANPNNRSGGWINDAVTFNNVFAALTPDRYVTTASTDAGVGLGVASQGVTYGMRVAANTGGLVDAARTAAIISNPTSLAVSATGTTYCGIEVASDALGNTTAVPAAGGACGLTTQSTPFGVDRAVPTSVFSANSMASNAGLAALTQIRVIANDTGLTGNSGFVGGTSIVNTTGTITRRTAASTSSAAVVISAAAASNVNIQLTRIDGAVLAPPVADTLVFDFSGITTDAYYAISTVSTDQAGNSSAALTRVVLKDNVAPAALVATQSVVAITAGGSVTFNTSVSDDLDLSTGTFAERFAAGNFSQVLNPAGAVAAAPAVYDIAISTPQVFNTYNVAPAVTSGTLTGTVAAFYALQSQTDSVTINAATSYPANIAATVTDMAANTFTNAAGVPQNLPAAPALYTAAADFLKFTLDRSGVTINATNSVTVGAAAAASRTITPRVAGTTTQAAPFQTLTLYILANGGTQYVLLGTATLTGQVDNGGSRLWSYSAVTVSSAQVGTPTGTATIIAIGQQAGGKAIMGQGVQLTVNP